MLRFKIIFAIDAEKLHASLEGESSFFFKKKKKHTVWLQSETNPDAAVFAMVLDLTSIKVTALANNE